jgi:RHS repeat-associated protein
MFSTYRNLPLFLLSSVILISSVFAQTPGPYPNTVPDRGTVPFTDQLSSPIDSVEPITGKLNMEIPLASLPPGRAGTGFNLTLTYNSSLYDKLLTPQKLGSWNPPSYPPEPLQPPAYLYFSAPRPAWFPGGWNYNFMNVGIFPEEREATFDDLQNLGTACSESKVRRYRTSIGLPDGSKHTLYLQGYSVTDGYYGIASNGLTIGSECDAQHMYGWNAMNDGRKLTYFTTDGTFLKLEINTLTGSTPSSEPWRLYFPDGKIISGSSWQPLEIDDANGNAVTFNNECDDEPCTQPYTRISDAIADSNREIRIYFAAETASGMTRDRIHATGSNGEDLNWAVDWQNISIDPVYYDANYALFLVDPERNRFLYSDIPNNFLSTSLGIPPGVKYIQAPSINRPAGSVPEFAPLGQEPGQYFDTNFSVYDESYYKFDYRDNSGTASENGIGQLKSAKTPSGAIYTYVYNEYCQGLSSSQNVPTTHLVDKCAVTQRSIQYEDGTLTWNYGYNWDTTYWTMGGDNHIIQGSTSIENPDGGVTQHNYSSQAVEGVSPNWAHGNFRPVIYSIVGPDGSVRDRQYKSNYADCDYQCSIQSTGQNVYVSRELVSVADNSNPPVPTKTAITDYNYDRNGNLLSKTEYDWVNYGITSGVTEKRKTTFKYNVPISSAATYYYNADSQESYGYWRPDVSYDLWPEHQPRRTNAVLRKTISMASSPYAVSEYTYDNPYSRANVTQERHWDNVKSSSLPSLNDLFNSSSQYLSTSNAVVLSRSYDTYGNLTDIYEPEVRTHYTYNSGGNYVEYAWQGYGTSEQRITIYLYDVPKKRVIQQTDYDNNVTTYYTYDKLGRQHYKDIYYGSQHVKNITTTPDDVNRTVTVESDLSVVTDNDQKTRTSYDALGRVKQTQKWEDPGWITVSTYDFNTQPSYPYGKDVRRVVTSTPYRSTSDATLEWTCTQYDHGGRVAAVAMFKGSSHPTDCMNSTNRTGITQTYYSSEWTEIHDPAGNMNSQMRDALGRLVEVVEDPDINAYITTYQYDPLDNLVQVNQGNQTRTFSYSSLGRLLSATNPESGTTSYLYNDSGDLVQKTDARSISTVMTYDSLHRVLSKTYSDSSPQVNYEYYLAGSSTPNVGKMKAVSSTAASTTYGSYDALGNVMTSANEINGYSGTLTFQYHWYLSGDLKWIQYPSGREVNYEVNKAGWTDKVYATGVTYADMTVVSYPFTADGRIVQMKLGNNLYETHDYNSPGNFNTGETSTFYKLGSAPEYGDLIQLEYKFDATHNNGNLQAQWITRGSTTWHQAFQYDALNRLHYASEDSGFNRTYDYDQYGNRRVSSSTGLAHPDSREPTSQNDFNSTNNRLIMSGLTYDYAGNQTAYSGFSLGYDAENRNTTVTSSGNGSGSFSYDGDGRRVKKVWTPYGGSTTTTFFVYDALGRMAAEYSTETSSPTGTSYMFNDMLGSVRAITNGSGAVSECYDYLPFGRMLSAEDYGRSSVGCYPSYPDSGFSSIESQKFTGKERDTETGLDYFGARYYSAAQARFTSIDPVALSSKKIIDPQQLNMYAYSRNNPLKYIDPNGEEVDLSALDEDERDMLMAAMQKESGLLLKYNKKTRFLEIKGRGKGGSDTYRSGLTALINDKNVFNVLSESEYTSDNQTELVNFGLYDAAKRNIVLDFNDFSKKRPEIDLGLIFYHEGVAHGEKQLLDESGVFKWNAVKDTAKVCNELGMPSLGFHDIVQQGDRYFVRVTNPAASTSGGRISQYIFGRGSRLIDVTDVIK